MICNSLTAGSFNDVQNWDYAGVVEAFNGDTGAGVGTRVNSSWALDIALERARSHDGLTLIECEMARDDCSLKLLEWGQRVARSNMRPSTF